MQLTDSIHIDLDGAWSRTATDSYLNCREWGRKLRYSAPTRAVEEFYEFIRDSLTKFTLFGSGDFHHLSALWLRQFVEPITLVSFDNHPDWDIRPPHWCCGTWINRALELPAVRRAVIWGCGNFELNWPNHLFVSRRGLREHRLDVFPWTERLKPSGRRRWPGITREDWQEKFSSWAQGLTGEDIYVTVDLDCLDREESATNWENGLFKVTDIEWALGQIRAQANIVGGDLCGAYSEPQYARWRQRIEATLDHPRPEPVNEVLAATRNTRAREIIWRALTEAGQTVEAGNAVEAGNFPRQSANL